MVAYNIYPFLEYNKYIGKPLYKFSKKHFGRSILMALNAADLPPSLAWGLTYYDVTQNLRQALFVFAAHQLVIPLALLGIHNLKVRERNQNTLEKMIEN
ncbi:MAG TPA: hypothetical protein VJJ52_04840 [Candidatus Nanoarchaeia archaeon]|nr:hypothetical protein [Candidatus Nanoarchaeia archaeon]